MGHACKHRGPEQEGFYVDNYVSFGCERLKIQDLSEIAKQPVHNEDKTIWVVLNGEIYNDESVNINVEANAEDIMMGDYMAHIFVSTNIESTIDFPVSLSVNDEELLLGDVNQDGDINVLDIVSLVSVVLDDSSEYIEAGDMNQDGQLDVLDIVSFVQIILNI